MTKYKQDGISHIIIPAVVLVVGVISFALWRVYSANSDKPSGNSQTIQSSNQTDPNAKTSTVVQAPKEADSADTLPSPEKITSSDGKTYFIYGAPAGQNNKDTKRIIVSLPGHGTTADDGYKAWKTHIEGGQYALAEFNWWDGNGENKTDYYSPPDAVKQIREFLTSQDYTSNDIVILHGFSRGSANTYAVIANDRIDSKPVFDAVISNSGRYEADFPLSSKTLTDTEITKLFKNFPWILVCGGKDPNTKSGCPGMEDTKSFLTAHQANVLALLTDPNQGHGVFHMSSLGLPKQALELIENALD